MLECFDFACYSYNVSLTWKKDGPSTLRIHESGQPLIRLFGVPFAAGGVYFLYHLFVGAFYSIRAGEFLSFLPGSLLLILMAALFGVPGMILLFGSRTVNIDTVTRTIEVIRNYGFYKKREKYSSSDYSAVQALHELKKVESKQNRSVKYVGVFPVRLIARSGKDLEIAQADQDDAARTLATEVGGTLGISAMDRTSEWNGGSLRQEEEEQEQVSG